MPVRQLPRDLDIYARASTPKRGGDWFRMENHATESDTTHIYIYDEIGYWGTTAQDFVEQLMAVDTQNIHLHINSPGGRVFDGIAIYNALKAHEATVKVTVDALAASAASFIAMGGDEVLMTKAGTLMIHDAIAAVYGNAKDMEDTARLLDKISNTIADIYQGQAGGTTDEWRGLMKEETWYNSQEALDAGLVDGIVDVEDEAAQEAANKWNLSIYNFAGRDKAPSPAEVREKVQAQLKEASVAPKATAPKASEAPAAPATPPAQTDPAPGTETPPNGDGETVEEQTGAPAGGDTGTTTDNKTGTQPTGATSSVVVNGQQFTVPAAVATEMASLTTFRDDTVKNGRKDFVKSLAAGNNPKILATQIEAMEKFALSLSPQQFDDWKASWDAAPGQSLLAPHGGGGTTTPANGGGTQSEIDARIEILEGVVNQHRLANMPQSAIENTDSYKELQTLKAQKAQG